MTILNRMLERLDQGLLAQRRIIVWYDPRAEFVPFVDRLATNVNGGSVLCG